MILEIVLQYGRILRMECVRMDFWIFQKPVVVRRKQTKSAILIYIQSYLMSVDLYCTYGSMLVHMDPYGPKQQESYT